MPLHPKLVHLPIALAVLMPMLSLGLLLAWWRGALPRRTWILVIAFQGLLVASGFAALRTGEQDEERVERVVPEAAIEAHEEAAELFVIGGGVVFALALGAGVVRRERIALAGAALATAGTVVVLGLGYRTGQAGGELVYRHGAAAAFTDRGAGSAGQGAPRAGVDDD